MSARVYLGTKMATVRCQAEQTVEIRTTVSVTVKYVTELELAFKLCILF